MSKTRSVICTTEQVEALLKGKQIQISRRVKLRHKRKDLEDISWIKAWHPDGGGNWIGWSCNSPGLAAFTKRAYPTGEGVVCPLGKPGGLLSAKEIRTRSASCIVLSIVNVKVKRIQKEWHWVATVKKKRK